LLDTDTDMGMDTGTDMGVQAAGSERAT